MKLVTRCFFFFALLLAAGVARGQSCELPNPMGGCTFDAFDAATGQPVSAFCVGRGVRFAPCPSRTIDDDLVFYGVLPGVGTTFTASTPRCKPPFLSPAATPYVYTPQPADVGTVTVSELANEGNVAKYYIRTFRVYATPPPSFTLLPCPGGGALVTVTDATYDSYSAQVSGNPATFPVTRTPGTVLPVPAGATVTVTGSYAATALCTASASQPLPALAPPQTPLFTSLTLQGALPGGAATLAVGQLPAGYRYVLQLETAGAFRDVAPVPAGSSSVALPSAPAGCYRLLRTDACGGSPATSATICTLSLTGSSTQNRNQLALTTSAGPGTTYAVTRNGIPLTTFTGTPPLLEDANVQCGTTYAYRVTATQPGGGAAASNEVAVRTESALPPRQPQLLASFNLNNVVELTPLLAAPLAPGSTLRYRRAAGGRPAADFGNVAATARAQRDSAALAELRANPPCYSLRLTDVCGNAAPESASTCPALLTARADNPDGTAAALTWSAFVGPDPATPAVYALQRLAADGRVLSTAAVNGGSYTDLTPPPDQQVLRYRLQISGAGLPAGTFSYSNLATVTRRLFLNIPTAFTPNGDGLNDVLEVKGKYLQKYTFVVVDRNGQEVFRGTQRTDTWDGRIRGRAPVLGTYAWRFQQTDEDGQPFTATGSVTILK
ncbi:gliding motility-associated C-terminal domain-containing protein [Hymenobacter sp.]|uniref:T9SS type B sorting domain-containing protein n=1 Tax=Hymenobacter sp. TaxID=1898978 RepID=UPI00286A2492|nr:gliding motility-associated C-terminal domain-containing protein [Hymenobacter sp.]